MYNTMSCKVLVGLLCFSAVYNRQTFAANAVEGTLSDVLNALLGHRQWARFVDIKAIRPGFENRYFSGYDLHIHRGLYSSPRTKNTGNSHVDVGNVYEKFLMVVNLLECMYAHLTDIFLTLIKNILSVHVIERNKSKNKAFIRQQRYFKNLEQTLSERSTTADDVQHDHRSLGKTRDNSRKPNSVPVKVSKETYIDFDFGWEVFHFAHRQLLDSQPMFEHMYDALTYLYGLVPPEAYVLHHPSLYHSKKLLQLIVWYKDISVNFQQIIPTYSGKNDVEYKSKVSLLVGNLFKSINGKNQHSLKPFAIGRCIFPPKENPDIRKIINKFKTEFPAKNKTDIIGQFEVQIQELRKKVFSNYYSDLGFVFSSCDDLNE